MRRLSAFIFIFLSLLVPTVGHSQTSSTPVWFTLNVNDGDTITATGSITLRYGQVTSTCVVTMGSGPCVNGPGTPTPETWTNPQTFTAPSAGATMNIVVGAAAFGGVDPLPGVYKTVQVQEQTTAQNISVNGQPITIPALPTSPSPTPPTSTGWFTLNVNDGDTITANGSITLRYGQVASTCVVPTSSGPCVNGPGTPTPETWTNPQTFTAPSAGATMNIVVGAAAFDGVDPLPGVYKTVQVQEQTTAQNITVNGQPITIPAISTSPSPAPPTSTVWFTLSVNDGDTITATGSISLRYGQVASTCVVPTSSGPCVDGPGTPTPETWTNPRTFTAPSPGATMNIVVGAAAFAGVDPLPGVYKTVQVQEQTVAQNIAINGQPVTVPALSTSSTCQLIATPASIAFSNTTVGFTLSNPASITSNCPTAITINTAQASGSPFSISGLQTPFSLAPGQSQSFTAVFTPASAGTFTGNISFASNSAGVQGKSVALTGTGVAAQQGTLSSTPPTLSFGNVVVSSTQPATATITNTGSASVSVSSVSVSGTGFSLANSVAPFTLAVGKSIQLTVNFTPASSGSATGTLTIKSTAQNSTFTVPLTGTGTATTPHSVTLSWSDTGTQLAGYNVYRSTVANGSYTRINSTLVTTTSYSDQTVVSGTAYNYYVTAVGTNAVESAPSNQANVTIP